MKHERKVFSNDFVALVEIIKWMTMFHIVIKWVHCGLPWDIFFSSISHGLGRHFVLLSLSFFE